MNTTTSKGARLQNFLPVLLIGLAAVLFEVFNFTTTELALTDMIGDLRFNFSNLWGLRLATILTIAFCLVDFAGIARIFTPRQGKDEPKEILLLYAAWFLATLMNAFLTWWAVSSMVIQHQGVGVLAKESAIKIVPIFAAILVWTLRFLIIGNISVFANKAIHQKKASVKTINTSADSTTKKTSWFEELKAKWNRPRRSSRPTQKTFNSVRRPIPNSSPSSRN